MGKSKQTYFSCTSLDPSLCSNVMNASRAFLRSALTISPVAMSAMMRKATAPVSPVLVGKLDRSTSHRKQLHMTIHATERMLGCMYLSL